MITRTRDRCQSCFEATVLDGVCGICGYELPPHKRDLRALKAWTLIGNKYLVGRVLGSGGFGITYLAQNVDLLNRVALKEFYPLELVSRIQDGMTVEVNTYRNESPFQHGLEKFFREGQVLAKFRHPNIVRVLDVLRLNGTAYLAMEYLDGETVLGRLGTDETIPWQEAVQLMLKVTGALTVVHEAGIVHRDIKPDNIYLTSAGEVILLDFGGAKQFTVQNEHSRGAMYADGYAAPEQYKVDQDLIKPWTDVYGCGATLYRMIMGRKLPPAPTRTSDNVDWDEGDVPAAVRRAIEKAVSRHERDRFASIEEFSRALEKAARDSRSETPPSKPQSPPPSPPSPPPAPQPVRRVAGKSSTAKSRLVMPLVATTVVVAISLGALLWQNGSNPPTPHNQNGEGTPPPAPPQPPPPPPLRPPTETDQTRAILNTMLDKASEGLWRDADSMVEQMRRAAQVRVIRPVTQGNAATEAIARRQYAEAAAELARITEREPLNTQAWADRAYASLRLEQLDEARKYAGQALVIAADNAGAWATLAEVLALKNQPDFSRDAAQLAIYFSSERSLMIQHLNSGNVSNPFWLATRPIADQLNQIPSRRP